MKFLISRGMKGEQDLKLSFSPIWITINLKSQSLEKIR